MTAERDELAKVIHGAPAMIAWNGEQIVLADAVLAAGYRKQDPVAPDSSETQQADESRATGAMALALAELARRCIGPDGTVVKLPEEDSSIVRSSLISRIAEAAMNILDKASDA